MCKKRNKLYTEQTRIEKLPNFWLGIDFVTFALAIREIYYRKKILFY